MINVSLSTNEKNEEQVFTLLRINSENELPLFYLAPVDNIGTEYLRLKTENNHFKIDKSNGKINEPKDSLQSKLDSLYLDWIQSEQSGIEERNHMKFTIKNFKCFIDTKISMNRLTVLTGVNGSGKSSFIQSILLLRQLVAFAKDNPKGDIPDYSILLNEQYLLALGDSSDILSNNASDNNISFAFVNDKTNEILCYAQFVADNLDPTSALPVIFEKSMINNQDCPICRREFYYLNAERLGPRIRQELKYFSYLHTGWQGEYTAQLINLNGGFHKIEESRKFPNSQNPLLLTFQISDWLDFLLPGTQIFATSNSETMASQIRFENSFTRQHPTLAANMGLGISYVLPILATGLIAEAGALFLVENPEAHL
ncbi:MAG: AAA family ATPase, partial [Planctomycetaceae bacterium]|nr:AAA family ATPase [Planctomycetaceae bacterium]